MVPFPRGTGIPVLVRRVFARQTRSMLACLIGGLAITLFVAAACSTLAPVAIVDQAGPFVSHDGEPDVLFHVYERPGYRSLHLSYLKSNLMENQKRFYIESGLEMRRLSSYLDASPFSATALTTLEASWRRSSRRNPFIWLRIDDAGWPARCLTCMVSQHVDADGIPQVDVVGGLSLGRFRKAHHWTLGLNALPLRPHWGALCLNTLTYGAVLHLSVAGVALLRRRMRSRAGRCPKCGYLLQGSAAFRCPECGCRTPPRSQTRVGPRAGGVRGGRASDDATAGDVDRDQQVEIEAPALGSVCGRRGSRTPTGA